MNKETLKRQVDGALETWVSSLDLPGWSDFHKNFYINEVNKSVRRLLELCDAIRGFHDDNPDQWFVRGSRSNHNLIDSLVAQGQDITSMIWCCNLRDKITDPVESFYGINFSALQVKKRVWHKTTGKDYYMSCHSGSTTTTISKDGHHQTIPTVDFERDYTACKPTTPGTDGSSSDTKSSTAGDTASSSSP